MFRWPWKRSPVVKQVEPKVVVPAKVIPPKRQLSIGLKADHNSGTCSVVVGLEPFYQFGTNYPYLRTTGIVNRALVPLNAWPLSNSICEAISGIAAYQKENHIDDISDKELELIKDTACGAISTFNLVDISFDESQVVKYPSGEAKIYPTQTMNSLLVSAREHVKTGLDKKQYLSPDGTRNA